MSRATLIAELMLAGFARYGSDPLVSPVGAQANFRLGMDEWLDINVPLQSGCTAKPIYRTYIDATAGNDSWDGSVPVWTGGSVGPKQTAVVANWTGSKTTWFANEIFSFRAGQIHTLTAAGASIGLTSNKHLGAHWLPGFQNAGRPIIRSLNNAGGVGSAARACISASGTLSNISVSDLIIDPSDVPNRCGLSFYQTADGHTINNISIVNVDVMGGSITDAVGYGAFKVEYFGQYSRLAAYGVSKNILVLGCAARGYPGHGFVMSGTLGELLPNGRWHGVDVIDCVAEYCGAGYDTHGFTSYSGGVSLYWTSGGWTLTSGTTYWSDIDSRYGRDVPDIEMVYTDTGAGTEIFKLLKNTATPTTPAVGEFGFDASGGTGNLRLYVNTGLALSVANRFSTCVRPTRGVRYIGCIARGQKQAGRSGAIEGHGFAFDDFTSNCSMIECASTLNAGCGATINQGDNNQIIASQLVGNALGPVKGNFGWGHFIGKSVLIGSGYSDTNPGFKGFVHIAHASHRAYQNYAGALPAPETYGSTISECRLEYTGTDTAVGLVLGGTSGNAPPVMLLDDQLEPGVAQLTLGRVVCQGRRGKRARLPRHSRGAGVQA